MSTTWQVHEGERDGLLHSSRGYFTHSLSPNHQVRKKKEKIAKGWPEGSGHVTWRHGCKNMMKDTATCCKHRSVTHWLVCYHSGRRRSCTGRHWLRMSVRLNNLCARATCTGNIRFLMNELTCTLHHHHPSIINRHRHHRRRFRWLTLVEWQMLEQVCAKLSFRECAGRKRRTHEFGESGQRIEGEQGEGGRGEKEQGTCTKERVVEGKERKKSKTKQNIFISKKKTKV